MPGDITAKEVYEDRELLNRLGYGIFDVQWGSDGSIGSENIKDFSYVVAQDDDPRLYRHRVFQLVGRYYPNRLAKVIWDKFIEHKWVLSERAGREVDLKEAAEDWLANYSHAFLKEWTFKQAEVPERIRYRSEPRKSWFGIMTGVVFPNLRQLFDAGFSVTDVLFAAFRGVKPLRHTKTNEAKNGSEDGAKRTANSRDKKKMPRGAFRVKKLKTNDGFFYVKLIAKLTGHEIKNESEAQKRWSEILEHKWYMSEREGHDVGIQTAALDYYRRLNLLAETESGVE